jgi:hypothetical protein
MKTMETKTKKDQILNLLQSKGIVTQHELNTIAYRYGARINDLRNEGYEIETKPKTRGEFIYIYLGIHDKN